MIISNKIKKLAHEFREAITNKGKCGCKQPFEFVTTPEDFKKVQNTPCPLCGGRKIVILADENDLKA